MCVCGWVGGRGRASGVYIIFNHLCLGENVCMLQVSAQQWLLF